LLERNIIFKFVEYIKSKHKIFEPFLKKFKGSGCTKMSKKQHIEKPCFQIIPLGGLGEVGKNTWLFAAGDSWIIVDAGLGFPFNEFPGVELIFPSLDYLLENKEKIKAMIITHAHEDHIGGAVRILSQINIPQLFGSKLTVALLEAKIKDADIDITTTINRVTSQETISIPPFKISFLRTTHSVPDCYALLIDSPSGKIMFTSDFKFDFTPIDGEKFDIPGFVEAGNQGIKLLMSDSTNVERVGFSQSEISVGPNLLNAFQKAPKRIFISTFSSHIHRIQQILDAARQVKRNVCIIGYSLETFFKIARDTGYLKYPDDLMVPLDIARRTDDNKIVYICSGSQGEPSSTLVKMARQEHRYLSINPGDTIIFSANPIPGNERAVSKLQDELSAQGADLVYGREKKVHVSGHAAREELQLMLAITRPEHFLPVHGDYRMLVQHAELAAQMGIDPEKIYILENGDILESTDKGFKVLKKQIHALPVYYDSTSGGIVDEKILKDRMTIGQEGLILVFAFFDEVEMNLISVEIMFKGVSFATGVNEKKLQDDIAEKIKESFSRMKKAGTADISNLRLLCNDLTLKLSEHSLCCKPQTLTIIQKMNTSQ
jgi:ribonuclease J